jgi:hypothetical protein
VAGGAQDAARITVCARILPACVRMRGGAAGVRHSMENEVVVCVCVCVCVSCACAGAWRWLGAHRATRSTSLSGW